MLQTLAQGGVIMIPILVCSIIAVAIIIERLIGLHKIESRSRLFIDIMLPVLNQGDISKAYALSNESNTLLAQVCATAFKYYRRPREELTAIIEDKGRFMIPIIEKRLKTLAIIAHITPLLGLLGTVMGMMKTFRKIAALEGQLVTPAKFAGGIWEALITTAMGLSVAIPAYIFYGYLTSRSERFLTAMEETSVEIVTILEKIKRQPNK